MSIELILEALVIIEEQRKLDPECKWSGTIKCPACKCNLNYSVAQINDHVWGKCSTKDCLSWMM